MSRNAIGRMPVLKSVDDDDRLEIFRAVESLKVDQLRNFGAWQKIEGIVPDPELLYIEAEVEGVYFDPESKHFVILADVSVKSGEGDYIESIPTTMSASKANTGHIVIDDVSVNIPDPAPSPSPRP